MGPGRAAGIRWESRRGTGRCNDEDDEFSGWSGGGLTSTSTTETVHFSNYPVRVGHLPPPSVSTSPLWASAPPIPNKTSNKDDDHDSNCTQKDDDTNEVRTGAPKEAEKGVKLVLADRHLVLAEDVLFLLGQRHNRLVRVRHVEAQPEGRELHVAVVGRHHHHVGREKENVPRVHNHVLVCVPRVNARE